MRADWENVVGPVMDHLLARADVNPEPRRPHRPQPGGASLAPRAASAEHRLAACIADCGAFDLHAAAMARLPGPLARGLEHGDRAAAATVRDDAGARDGGRHLAAGRCAAGCSSTAWTIPSSCSRP